MKHRDSVIEYAGIIDELTDAIRRELSAGSLCTGPDKLFGTVEDRFFSCDNASNVKQEHVSNVISSVFERVNSKYGVLKELIDDVSVNEIMVNGPYRIFVERCRHVVEVDNAFTSAEELENIIRMFASDVHREINEANPIVDARLPQGYRVNGVLKNIALNGPILTIRKFSDTPITMEDLIGYGSVSEECSSMLMDFVRCGYNVFISGGTSSGKTTFLNALTTAIDSNERAVIIEDSAELKVNHLLNKVHMECRSANSVGKGAVTMEQLIKTSLRMRPDRIIVGEVRGREVVDMIQAMNTGHAGSMSTGHGNSIKGMLNRLETMYLMDSEIPIYSVKNQIANAIEVFVHLRRGVDGSRGVVEVAELTGFDGNEYKLNYLYVTDTSGKLRRTDNDIVNKERLGKKENEGLSNI